MNQRWDVVIVGAGLAGLAAARELQGLEVCVLEREAEPGGRVRTRRQHDIDYELGAVLPFPAALAPAIPLPPPDPAPMAIHLGGRLGRGDTVADCLTALGIADAPQACAAWSRGLDVPADVRRALDTSFQVMHPAPADVSLPERRVDALQRFPVVRRAGGNGSLIASLAGPPVVTRAEVLAIDDGARVVRVTVRDMDALRARAVICAVPAPVARGLGFATRVAFAPGTIVVVAVDDAASDAWSYVVTPDQPCSAVIQHHVPERGVRLLHAWFVGNAAERLAAMPRSAVVAETLAALHAIGATRTAAPLFADVQHWPMAGPVIDEATYGRRDTDTLQPSAHVVLAGDWTFGRARTDLPYGMSAAILSGRAAGRRVRHLLGGDGREAHRA